MKQKTNVRLLKFLLDPLIKKCANCSMCREECPTYMVKQNESFFAGGRLRLLRAFAERDYAIDQDFQTTMAFCTTCKQCEDRCPISMEYVEVLEELRKEMASSLHHGYGNTEKFVTNAMQNKNPYGEDEKLRGAWIPDDINVVERGEVAYFAGCTASYRSPDTAQITLRLLAYLYPEGVVALGAKEFCCGSPYIRTGQVDFTVEKDQKNINFQVSDLIKNNVQTLVERGVKTVIFSCSGCYKTAMQDWPKFTDVPFERIHLSQILAKAIEEGRITLKSYPKTITYHDPCHLGRHMKEFDAPRAILNAIPDVTIHEMRHSRNRALCCGAGAGVKAGFPDLALEIAKMRVKEAQDINAEVIVTACLFCKNNLQDAMDAVGSSIEVLDLSDLVWQLLN